MVASAIASPVVKICTFLYFISQPTIQDNFLYYKPCPTLKKSSQVKEKGIGTPPPKTKTTPPQKNRV